MQEPRCIALQRRSWLEEDPEGLCHARGCNSSSDNYLCEAGCTYDAKLWVLRFLPLGLFRCSCKDEVEAKMGWILVRLGGSRGEGEERRPSLRIFNEIVL